MGRKRDAKSDLHSRILLQPAETPVCLVCEARYEVIK